MSSRQFEKVLHLKLKRSYTLTMLLVTLHVAGLMSILVALSDEQIIIWFFMALVTLSFIYHFPKMILLRHPRSVISVTQTRQGVWSIRFYNNELVDAHLCDDSYKHPLLVILNFKTNLGRFSVPLFPDALDDDLHRQLRCRLTLSRPAEEEKLLRR